MLLIVLSSCIGFSCSSSNKTGNMVDAEDEFIAKMNDKEKWYDWRIIRHDTIVFKGDSVPCLKYILLGKVCKCPTTFNPIKIISYKLKGCELSLADIEYDCDPPGDYSSIITGNKIMINKPDTVVIINSSGKTDHNLDSILGFIPTALVKYPVAKFSNNVIGNPYDNWVAKYRKTVSDGKITLKNIDDPKNEIILDYYDFYKRFIKSRGRKLLSREKIGDKLTAAAPPFLFVNYKDYCDCFYPEAFIPNLEQEPKIYSKFLEFSYF